MATIQVWHQVGLDYQQTANCLALRLSKGVVRARIPGAHWVKVSDKLAAKVLDARDIPCPNNGKLPEFGLSGEETFRAYGRTSIEEGPAVYEICRECGFTRPLREDPRLYAAVSTTLGEGVPHPPRTIKVADRSYGIVRFAEWNGQLEPGTEEGLLIFWVKGWKHLTCGASVRSALERFPYARIVHEEKRLIILQAG